MTLVESAELGNELDGEAVAGPELFDRDGWVVGRGVLPADLVREVRRPMVQALLEQGLIEPSPLGADRFRWIGDAEQTKRNAYGSGALQHYRESRANDPLVVPGHARAAVQRMWGRPAKLWANTAIFLKFPERCAEPSGAHVGHSDGWQLSGVGAPREHFNLWIPLTQFATFDGSMAILPGSDEHPPETYPDAPFGLRPEDFADAPWRSTGLAVGDALLFRPALSHAAVVNRGDDVRMAIVIRGQDGRIPLPPAAGMSGDRTQELSVVEELALAVLAVAGPLGEHQVKVACDPRGLVGRYRPFPPQGQLSPEPVMTQALRLLRARDLVEQAPDGDRFARVQITAAGRSELHGWLDRPIADVDGVATLLPLKLELLDALGRSGAGFVRAQLVTLDRLDGGPAEETAVHAAWRTATIGTARRLLEAVAAA